MKLYVLYEQTCDGESCHRYFLDKENASNALRKSEWYCDELDVVSYWKLIEVETED